MCCPKPSVEGAILKDYKVALTLNDGQKVNSYFSACFTDVNYNLEFISADLN